MSADSTAMPVLVHDREQRPGAEQWLAYQCNPPNNQISSMIGIGMPISHSKIPRPIVAS
jgi:hypothetical protein